MWVVALPGEPFDALLSRFKRGVERDGILRECRHRRHFVPRHEERRAKIIKAKRRQARRAA